MFEGQYSTALRCRTCPSGDTNRGETAKARQNTYVRRGAAVRRHKRRKVDAAHQWMLPTTVPELWKRLSQKSDQCRCNMLQPNNHLPPLPNNPHEYSVPARGAVGAEAPEKVAPGGADIKCESCQMSNHVSVLAYERNKRCQIYGGTRCERCRKNVACSKREPTPGGIMQGTFQKSVPFRITGALVSMYETLQTPASEHAECKTS